MQLWIGRVGADRPSPDLIGFAVAADRDQRPRLVARGERLIQSRRGYHQWTMLKSAYEIALDKHEKHSELSEITAELLEHVRLLDEGWNSIHPSEDPADDELPRAA